MAEKHQFFKRFISFDCTDKNDGFDVEAIQWFRPPDMERVLRRLWFFGGRALGIDIAEDCGSARGQGGSRWRIVTGDAPQERRDALESWIRLVQEGGLKDCIVCISYTTPEPVLDLFVRASTCNGAGQR